MQHEQNLSGVMDLLSASVCTKITVISGKKQQISQDNACLELYTNKQLLAQLTQAQIGTFNKVFNLSRVNTDVPDALVATLLIEVQEIVAAS